jgi:hypothetical protein
VQLTESTTKKKLQETDGVLFDLCAFVFRSSFDQSSGLKADQTLAADRLIG